MSTNDEAGAAQALNEGLSLAKQGQNDLARAKLEAVLEVDSAHAEAHYNLALLATRTGDLDGAEQHLRTALAAHGDNAQLHLALGDLLWRRGNGKEAQRAYAEALRLEPDSVITLVRLGTLAQSGGNLDEAARYLSAATQAEPDSVLALQGLAGVLYAAGDFDRAIGVLNRCLKLEPGNARSLVNLGIIYHARGRFGRALQAFERALEVRPEFAAAHSNIGKIHQLLGDLELAREHFEKALELAPGHPEATAGLAVQMELRGEVEAGLELLRPLVEAGRINAELAVTYANLQRRQGEHATAAALLERVLASSPSSVEQSHVHFTLGDLYDEQGAYDHAFTHYREGNRLKSMRFDGEAHRQRVQKLLDTFTPERLERLPHARPAEPTPILIVGMPRSGTTLVEQILAGHPQVRATGERDEIGAIAAGLAARAGTDAPYPDCVEAVGPDLLDELAREYRQALGAGTGWITDKMPANFMHLGLIQLLLPDARIVHCVRDPLDTALSCYFQNFSSPGMAFSFDLEHIPQYIAEYQRLMNHWKSVLDLPIIDVVYEELVADFDTGIAGLLEALGLPWDDACRDFHRQERVVMTASHNQVRQPLYATSVGRARHYEKHLGDLADRLRRI